jgi:hypothetical protein
MNFKDFSLPMSLSDLMENWHQSVNIIIIRKNAMQHENNRRQDVQQNIFIYFHFMQSIHFN